MGIIFITGGARSGKSSFAEEEAKARGKTVVYIATAQALDEEMSHRIQLHKKRRPKTWTTIEEPIYLSKALKKVVEDKSFNCFEVVLIDCLALLVSNWLPLEEVENTSDWSKLREKLLKEISDMIELAKRAKQQVIIVSNEVGSGLVPPYPLGRLYRDLLGEVNQRVAKAAQEVYFAVSGIPLKIK